MNRTAIENFACVIFNVSFMNCTWHVDRTSSGDTQYFLYWKTSKKEDFTGCQNYIKDDCGRHTGCRFQNVTIENKRAYFLLNVSRSGQNIQSYKKTIILYEIEKLTPPLNVTVNCTEASHNCKIQWQPPRTSHVKKHTCFKYEVVIENKVIGTEYPSFPGLDCTCLLLEISVAASILKTWVDPEQNFKTTSKRERSITGNSYIFGSFSAVKRYRVKIRATDNGCLVSTSWGEWSTPIEFGKEQFMSTTSYMMLLISLLTASLALFLCTVSISLKQTSATVPQPKDLFHELLPEDFQAEHRDQLIKQETEEITIIEEVT